MKERRNFFFLIVIAATYGEIPTTHAKLLFFSFDDDENDLNAEKNKYDSVGLHLRGDDVKSHR